MFLFGKFYSKELSSEEIKDIEDRHTIFEVAANNFINAWYKSDETKKTIWSLYKNKVLYIEKLKDKDLYEMNTPEEIKDIVSSMPTTSQLNKRKLFDFINSYLTYCETITFQINFNSCNSLDPDEVCKVSEKSLINKLVSRDKLWSIVEEAKECIESNCIMGIVLARYGIYGKEGSEILNLRWQDIDKDNKTVTIVDKEGNEIRKTFIDDERFYDFMQFAKDQVYVNFTRNTELIQIEDYVIKEGNMRIKDVQRNFMNLCNKNQKCFRALNMKSISFNTMYQSYVIERLLEIRKNRKLITEDILNILRESNPDVACGSYMAIMKLYNSIACNDQIIKRVSNSKNYSLTDENSLETYNKIKEHIRF